MNIFRLFLAIGFLASSASLFGMDEQQRQLATNMLNQKIWHAVEKNTAAKMDLSMNAGNHTGENRLPFLEGFNAKYKLGFDTAITKIKNGVPNPFGDETASPAAPQPTQPPAPDHTFTDVTITDEDIKNAIAKEPTIHLNDSDDEEDHPVSKSITFTQKQKDNAQIPYKSTQYQDDAEDLGTGTGISFTCSPVTITKEDLKNARAWNPKSSRLSKSDGEYAKMFQHGLNPTSSKLVSLTPLFVGIIAFCGIVIGYTYWHDQHKKNVDKAEDDTDTYQKKPVDVTH